MAENKNYSFEEFMQIIAALRAENGCPWDKIQTHESLKPCIIEEAYEVYEGINQYTSTGNDNNLCEELGDVLLQVAMHSQIAKEEGRFTEQDVINGISEKMIRRHPHVFGDISVDSPEGVLENWEEIKKKEKSTIAESNELKAIPRAFPALIRAEKICKKIDKMKGYKDISSSGKDIIKNVMNIMENGDSSKDIFGEILMDIVNLARLSKVNAEEALVSKIDKIINE